MKKTLLTAALMTAFGVVAIAPLGAKASDGTITINGAITKASCTISVNGGTGGNATVTLPTMQTSSFTGAGTTGGWTAIQIALSGCAANGASPTVSTVSPYFEQGPNVDTTTGYLKVGTGTATGVEVILSTTNTTTGAVNLNAGSATQYTGTAPTLASNPTFTYYAAYVQPTATAVGAGSVATSVQYDLNYK